MNPLNKPLAIVLAVVLLVAGGLGAGLWYQLRENGALAAREDAQKLRNDELAASIKTLAETMAQAQLTLTAIQDQMNVNQQAADNQMAAINRGIKNAAINDRAWAAGRVPDSVLVELCRAGLVSPAARGGLCPDTAPAAGGLPGGAAGRR